MDEKFLGVSSQPVIDLATLVQQHHIVELPVSFFRTLVDGDQRGNAQHLSRGTKCLTEFKGCGRVQTSGSVIPALEDRTVKTCFGDRDTLTFTTGNTTDEVVTNVSIPGVEQTESSHHNQGHVAGIFFTIDPGATVLGSSHSRSKLERLPHGKLREVDVQFGREYDVTTQVGLDIFRSETIVSDFRFRVHSKAVRLSCNGFE